MSDTDNGGNVQTFRKWRKRSHRGTEYVEAPDGARYYGTAAEVRDAALYPVFRDSIASTIRLFHRLYVRGEISREELRDVSERRRRECVMLSFQERRVKMGCMDENEKTLIGAAARATGTTELEYVRAALMSAVDRTRKETGGELPFTRHERAALIAGGCAMP